jgi:hypothetical protein
MRGGHRQPAAIVCLALGAVALLAGCGASETTKAGGGGGSAGATLRFHGVGIAFLPGPHFAGKPGVLTEYSIADDLADKSGDRVGQLEIACGISAHRGSTDCLEVIAHDRGQIVARGIYSLNGPAVVPIIGGSGAYRDARGTLNTTGRTARGEDMVVHLKPAPKATATTILLGTRQTGLRRGAVFTDPQNRLHGRFEGSKQKLTFREWSTADALTDSSGKVVGSAEMSCTTSPRPGARTCTQTIVLPHGEIDAVGVFDNQGRGTSIPIVGGTGQYVGAHGTVDTAGSGGHGNLAIHLLQDSG